MTVVEFLDEYFKQYAEGEALKSMVTIQGHIKQLKEALGELPVTALEKTQDIARFKAQYRKGTHARNGEPRTRRVAGGRQLGTLLSTSSFHRFASASNAATRTSEIDASIATRSNSCSPRVKRLTRPSTSGWDR